MRATSESVVLQRKCEGRRPGIVLSDLNVTLALKIGKCVFHSQLEALSIYDKCLAELATMVEFTRTFIDTVITKHFILI